MPGRTRGARGGGCLRALVVTALVLVLLGVAVVAVVALLERARPSTPLAERCVAHLDGTDWSLSPEQAENAALVSGIALRRGLPARAVTIGLATALQESRLINIDYGDRDSIGLFQQRPSQGWGTIEQIMDPVYSTTKFYEGLEKVPGYQDMAVTQAAQAVQRSAFPDAYAQHEVRSRAWASALTGWSPAALTCTLRPAEPGEDPTAGVLARITRDLGEVSVTVTTGEDPQDPQNPTTVLVVDATPLVADDAARAGWAGAQWAVATAWATGVQAVTVGDVTWSRDDPSWQPTGLPALPGGHVTLTL